MTESIGSDSIAPQPIGPGSFVAVVGASGVGKDALLTAARHRCDESVLFPRRAITRPPGPGEDFTPLSETEFADERERGAFAACWRAHGLAYGIPVSADSAIQAGRAVVANVSRASIAELGRRYERLVVVRITVSAEVREQRLRARSRESHDEIARRLARVDPAPDYPVDHEIHNDGSVAEGAAQLMSVIASAINERTETV